MTVVIAVLAGIALAIVARVLLVRALLWKLRRDVARLNRGDYGPLLAGYHPDAVLHFTEGPHRWSGEHRGRAAIERFLRDFVNAGLEGEVAALWVGGPPWALTMVARFDDAARGPDGERIYSNRTMLWVRTRWGRIVEQRDFYEDTRHIAEFDRRLRELGIEPVAEQRSATPA
jgi:ketosteroid isomerase-like protein